MRQPRWIGAEDVRRALSVDRARRIVRQALADGLDPSADPPRLTPSAGTGQLLVMPSAIARSAGVKVLSVAPGNPARGLERIQALYVLMDAETLTPSVLLDGAAVTSLRTPAVSAVAADCLAPPDVSSVVIVGAGPQAVGHAEAILAIRRPSSITVAARRADGARATAQRIAGIAPLGVTTRGLAVDQPAYEAAVRDAGLVVTATSSRTPVLGDDWVADGACVVAIGSHEPDARELGAGLVGRSQVVVEELGTARREAGDLVLAASEGAVQWDTVRTLAELVRGRVQRAEDRPNVFKSVGMAWQDLVIAEHVAGH